MPRDIKQVALRGATLVIALAWSGSPAHAAQERTGSSETADAQPPAREADAVAPADESAGRRVYSPADFARYAPRTALDMLQRVPGFAIRQAAVERGLGQASGNVLLNGRRISNKSDDVVTQLGRVPAANVLRIEIADAATLDVPGLSGQVANIVVEAARLSGQFSYSSEIRTSFPDPLLTRFSTSVSGRQGPVEYTLGLENQASRGAAGGPTLILNRDNSVRESRRDVWTSRFDQPRASARFVVDGPGSSTGNLNMIYREFWYDYIENGVRSRPGLLSLERDVQLGEDGHDYEVGGDFELALAGGRLKLIGLQRASHSVVNEEVTTTFRDGRPDQGSYFTRDGHDVERIGRAEYRWNAAGADWQLSGEAAFNALETSTSLARLRADGTIEPVPFPNSSARVEEARYEGIASYSRRLSPDLTVQVAAGAEYSQLSQAGAGGLTREFVRPKGQATAAWTPDEDTTANLRLQRKVGQISFLDFVSSVNLRDERETDGNVNLVPPQSWEAEVEAVRRLGPWGSTTLRAYYHLIDDVIDIVPVGDQGQGVGNLDRAARYGVDWRSTLNMDPIGWRGARFDTRLQLEGSNVKDPLTDEARPISGSLQRFAEVTFRYDLPQSDWAFGFGMLQTRYALSYRLTEVGLQAEGPLHGKIFVENKDVMGLTLRATLANVFDARSTWERFVYEGRRIGPLDFVELRDRLIGPIISVQIGGRF